MSDKEHSTIVSDGVIFIRDNTPGTKGSDPVGVVAVLPKDSIKNDGHHLLSFENADEGKLRISESTGLSLMMQHKVEEGGHEAFEDLSLNEMFRQEFFMIAAGHPACHGYARQAASGEDLEDTCVVLASCIRRDVANHLGLRSEHLYRLDGETPLKESGEDMTLRARGMTPAQIVALDEFTLSDGSRPHSGNSAEQDRQLRAFYMELAEIGPESSLEERDALYEKHCGDNWIGKHHYKEDEFVAFVQYRYRDGMSAEEAVRAVMDRPSDEPGRDELDP